ncbi:MAG: NAD-dependent epimerase/dehydratase family protein [Ilumatobacteraceae bacterium]
MSSSSTSGSPPTDARPGAEEDQPEHEPEPGTEHETGTGGVLVIGGAGFIGSHLVDRLIAEGELVDVIDDLSTGSLGNLAEARTAVAAGVSSQLHINTLDGGTDNLADIVALRRPREIYHLALLPRSASPTELGRSFTSMLGVLEAARRHGVTKVIVTLPATAMYGHPPARDLPAKEGSFVPRGVRGVVANAIVDLLGNYRQSERIEFTALATSTVYGPRQRPHGGVVAALVDAARRGRPPVLTGEGRQTRDFVFVDDVVDALVRSRRRGSGLVVNVGTGVQTAVRDLWTSIAPGGAPPTSEPARPDELMRFAVSPVRARIHLAWAPWTSLEDGLSALPSVSDEDGYR